jgi:hypothetical protein
VVGEHQHAETATELVQGNGDVLILVRRCRNRCHAAEMSESSLAPKPLGIVAGGDQEAGRDLGADSLERQEAGRHLGHQTVQLKIQSEDLSAELLECRLPA